MALAAAAATLGLLAVFHPFAGPVPAFARSDAPALHAQIDAAIAALTTRQETHDNVSIAVPSAATPDSDAELQAQISAAIERRDLATRQADAILASLKAGGDLASLAGIRDSVVIGQLLTQQVALDAQIAEQGARLKPSHPVMRGLLAQKRALAEQISTQARAIAQALGAEAASDDALIQALQARLGKALAIVPTQPPAASLLSTETNTQRAELDRLVDAYTNQPTASQPQSADLLAPLNLLVAAVAFIVAIVFQIALIARQSRVAALDAVRWREDRDPELPKEPLVAGLSALGRRRAA